MGLTSLENMEEFIEVNRRNYHYYQEGLANIPEISLFPVNESEKHNYQYIILDIDEEKTQVSRDLLIKILHAENVIARRYFYPGCHRMEPYRSYFPHAGLLLPETERLAQRVLILPTGTAISEDDISKICQIIQIVVANEIKETNRDSE